MTRAATWPGHHHRRFQCGGVPPPRKKRASLHRKGGCKLHFWKTVRCAPFCVVFGRPYKRRPLAGYPGCKLVSRLLETKAGWLPETKPKGIGVRMFLFLTKQPDPEATAALSTLQKTQRHRASQISCLLRRRASLSESTRVSAVVYLQGRGCNERIRWHPGPSLFFSEARSFGTQSVHKFASNASMQPVVPFTRSVARTPDVYPVKKGACPGLDVHPRRPKTSGAAGEDPRGVTSLGSQRRTGRIRDCSPFS